MGLKRKLIASRQKFTRRQRLFMGGAALVIAQLWAFSYPSQPWLYLLIFGVIVFISAWSPEKYRKG